MTNGDVVPVRRELPAKPLKLESLADYMQFAELIARSGLAPRGMDAATIAVALEFGAELGLPPLTALQNIAVINGRPTIWGDAALALCKQHPAWDESAFSEEILLDDQGQLLGARCTVRRHPGQPTIREFTVEDAKRARLWGREGCWSQYPVRMLQMRARAWALRDAFPDVLKGLYLREEMEVGDMNDTTELDRPTTGSTDRVHRLVQRIQGGNDSQQMERTDEPKTLF